MKAIDIERGRRWLGVDGWSFETLAPDDPRWMLRGLAVFSAAQFSALLRQLGV